MEEAKALQDLHCKNIVDYWTAVQDGNPQLAQRIFNADREIRDKFGQVPAFGNQDCNQLSYQPVLDNRCSLPNTSGGSGSTAPSTGPSGGGGGLSGGGGGSSGGGGGTSSPAPYHPAPVMGILDLAWLVQVGGTAPAPASVASKIQPPRFPYPKGLAPVPVLLERRARELAAALDRVNHPIPAPDFTDGSEPFAKHNGPKAPDGADYLSMDGFKAADWWGGLIDYLNSFATYRSRYEAAKAAGHADAMLLQAQAMVYIGDRLVGYAQETEKRQLDYERHAAKRLDEARAAAEVGGGSWTAALQNAANQIGTRAFPPEVRQELAAAGLTEQEIAAFKQQLGSVKPDTIEAEVAAIKGMKADSDSPLLTKMRSTKELAEKLLAEAKSAQVKATANKAP